MAAVDQVTSEIEQALVAHWSYLGRWSQGALVEELGTLRYETPVAQLPYNGVIRTHIPSDNADEAINLVVGSFEKRAVPFLWWEHPSASPGDLGPRLERHGLSPVEHVTGMSIELDEWSPDRRRSTVDYVEVLGHKELNDYGELIGSYWELPPEAQALVEELNRFWGPGIVPAHRWVAYADQQPIGKALLSLAGSPGVAAIYGMSVRPEARGQGVARGLTTTLLQRAKQLGCRRVVLHSSEMAVALYRNAGFINRCQLTVYATQQIWSGDSH